MAARPSLLLRIIRLPYHAVRLYVLMWLMIARAALRLGFRAAEGIAYRTPLVGTRAVVLLGRMRVLTGVGA